MGGPYVSKELSQRLFSFPGFWEWLQTQPRLLWMDNVANDEVVRTKLTQELFRCDQLTIAYVLHGDPGALAQAEKQKLARKAWALVLGLEAAAGEDFKGNVLATDVFESVMQPGSKPVKTEYSIAVSSLDKFAAECLKKSEAQQKKRKAGKAASAGGRLSACCGQAQGCPSCSRRDQDGSEREDEGRVYAAAGQERSKVEDTESAEYKSERLLFLQGVGCA
jgi:hypothetical protein